MCSAVAGRVTGTGDLESLFELRADQEPWFARDKECVIRDQLFTTSQISATNLQRAIDPWASRRGKLTQAQFMLPSDVVFVRPQLVRAIRALFVSPRQALGTWVDEKHGASMMEISHVKAIVRMVQSERPEDLEKVCVCGRALCARDKAMCFPNKLERVCICLGPDIDIRGQGETWHCDVQQV